MEMKIAMSHQIEHGRDAVAHVVALIGSHDFQEIHPGAIGLSKVSVLQRIDGWHAAWDTSDVLYGPPFGFGSLLPK